MDDSAILFLIGGAFLSLVCGFISMRMARKRRYIRDTPTSKAAGVFIGEVEVKGTAESAAPLVSFLAEARCVYYTWTVEEHWRRTRIETYTDSKGNTRTRTRVDTGWDTVASGGEQIPFYLLDDSGYILIRPDGMDVTGVEVFGFDCTPGHPLYYGKGPQGSVDGSTDERRFTESAIPIHTPIFVMGAARERKDTVAAEIAHSNDARFSLITTESEESVAGGYTVSIWVLGVLGAILAVAGGGLFASAREIRGNEAILVCLAAFAAYLVALSFLWSVMHFNTLLAHRQRVRRGWANIDVELKRRSDLFPNLVATVKGIRAHEAETQQLIATLRAQAVIPPSAAREGLATVEGVAPAVVALAERYPDLKAGGNFLALQEELVRTESRIALARTYYNGMVTAFNARIAVFPDSILARVGGLKPFAFFEAKGFEREATQVEFVR